MTALIIGLGVIASIGLTLYTFFCLLGWLFFHREGNPFCTLCLVDGILLILYLAWLFVILMIAYFIGCFITNC